MKRENKCGRKREKSGDKKLALCLSTTSHQTAFVCVFQVQFIADRLQTIKQRTSVLKIRSLTSPSRVEVEYSAGLAPAELVPRLHQTLILRVLPETGDFVLLDLVEAVGRGVLAGDDHVGPVAAALEQDVVADLKRDEIYSMPEYIIKVR